ncbi:Hypothetical protein HVR_LOCUS659 [uncultured virus]|nr:Hypothetical protein HVR_LOCUS659 [uncultured virus]
MSSAWAVWLVIILMLLACLGIIIWFAIDNNIPGKIGSDQGHKIVTVSKTGTTVTQTTS